MILMIDNYDSFTYNLVQYFRTLGVEVRVERNDAITVAEALALGPAAIVIGPGPGRPADAGICTELVGACAGELPVLGVCLGLQCIAAAFGATIRRARQPRHGMVSEIHHDGGALYRGVPSPFIGTRYHSLVVDRASVPECLEQSAWTVDDSRRPDELMGLRHRTSAIEGIQFHPEAILTEHGMVMLANFAAGIRSRAENDETPGGLVSSREGW